VGYSPDAGTPYYEQDPAVAAALLERLRAAVSDRSCRVLLRGATVISMDPEVGDFVRGDVLVSGSEIAAVAPDLSEAGADGRALVVDLTGMILVPGFCDAHRHCWQNQFRRVLCDVDDLDTYMASTHEGIALHYRPEDIYVGNRVSLLGALDSGVTCVLDFSHNSRSAAHSDAAFRAYRDTGVRAVHVSAPPNAGTWDNQWPADVARLKQEHATADGMITVRMGIDLRPRPNRTLVQHGRDAGVAITIDGVMGATSSAEIEQLGRAGGLGPDVTLVHCTDLTDATWRLIADSGTRVTLAPTSDEQLGLADAVPPVQKALDYGIRPSLSVDIEVALATDMFSQMRATLATQRMHAAARRYHGEPDAPPMISTRDVLEFATAQGAKDIGLAHAVGSLTPGKQADVVAIRADDLNNFPLNNAVGTVVLGADARNVDTVLVAGAVRKWRGELVGQDIAGVRRAAYESRDHIAAQAGFPIDVLAEGKGWSERSTAKREWGPSPSPTLPDPEAGSTP
jgi:cytosine/adenosine deaminase-related metal-dependent hydrolase